MFTINIKTHISNNKKRMDRLKMAYPCGFLWNI